MNFRPPFVSRQHPFLTGISDERRSALACGQGECCAYCGQAPHYRLHRGSEPVEAAAWWMFREIFQ